MLPPVSSLPAYYPVVTAAPIVRPVFPKKLDTLGQVIPIKYTVYIFRTVLSRYIFPRHAIQC